MFFFFWIFSLMLKTIICNAISKGCYEYQDGYLGMFSSKNYPNKYENNAFCEWKLTSPNSTVIQLRFTDFELEKSSGCRYDFLEIYNENPINFSLIGRFCGNEIPDVIISSSNSIYLRFQTDKHDVKRGFEATWIAVSKNHFEESYISKRHVNTEKDKCGGIRNSNEGSITSPNFPNNYPASSHCVWILESNQSSKIVLNFKSFDLEKHIECRYDYVVVKDGRTRNAKVIGQYCGSRIPQEISTNGSALYIEFVSDTSTQNKGFEAAWKMIPPPPISTLQRCGAILNGETGVLISPEYPNGFQNKDLCTWIINVPESGQVELIFEDFHVDVEHTGCSKAYVQLHDGHLGQKLGLFCGTYLPKSVLSKTNSMTVVFLSDGVKASRGFRARWVTTYPRRIFINPSDQDTACSELVKPTGYINVIKPKNCTWNITVPVKKLVEIFIINIDMADDPDCHSERIEVRDYVNAPLLFRTCGQLKSKPILTSSNTAFIQHMVLNTSRLSFLKLFWQAVDITNSIHLQRYDNCASMPLESVKLPIFDGMSSPSKFPWVAAVIGMYGRIHCAGAILSPEWVLTAAHCFQRLPLRLVWRIRAGDYDLMKDDGFEQDRAIKNIFIHPNYGFITHDNDIALLQLEERLYFNDRVSNVCLPSENTELPIGKKCSVAGWGARKFLRQPEGLLAHVEPKIVSQNECNSLKAYNKRVTDRMFCAGDDGVDSCQGDGGSPIICIDQNHSFAFGLASWGNGCAFPGKYGVYTDVRKFRQWIDDTIELN
ncbi:tolloid-like protein 1 isoform X2 [Hydra vulgaris]|uniref:tolloid-like protein 1 isoform X2 n=2 Tax=Hydra vulgaris TaxID=6087 RepID=UPI0001927323|nr:tolloid-like protein 1 isoform X1 [Hydra vulgaris]